MSVGYETGTETTNDELERMEMTRDVGRVEVGAEGFMRIGVAFDM